jgi:hypothetical protein
MTAPQAPQAPPAVFTYAGGNAELDALLAAEETAKIELDAAKARHDELAERLKAAFTAVTRPTAPGDGVVQAPSTPYERYTISVPGQAKRSIVWRVQRRINSQALKAALPEVYETYSQAKGSWYLERAK